MIKGIIFSVTAGIVIAMQSVFSARLSEKVGFFGSNFFIHGTGFLLASLLLLLFGKGELSIESLKGLNPIYATSGFIGVLIIFSIAQGVSALGASRGIVIIVVTQIVFALIINVSGLFGETPLHLTPAKITGLLLMLFGVLIYQLAK
jgi:transporter family-2 protein